uniref:Uncharacterized protein n=1 Tax=Rhizophagus irregularis (strain DAOM 181602 / DAOM 197198 / MUCL 43194) TaxID=747089 RepID=U9U4R7_RHIID
MNCVYGNMYKTYHFPYMSFTAVHCVHNFLHHIKLHKRIGLHPNIVQFCGITKIESDVNSGLAIGSNESSKNMDLYRGSAVESNESSENIRDIAREDTSTAHRMKFSKMTKMRLI